MRRILIAVLLLTPLAAQPDRYGLPACEGPHQELSTKRAFIVCHDGARKAPVWTIHEISASHLSEPASPRRHRFRRDRTLGIPGASGSDYRGSGMSRSHLVPARDVAFDGKAVSESFLLSNVVPQDSTMNRSSWRRLENRVRALAGQADSAIVVTGAIYPNNPDRIGSGVAIPSHLYKVILIREPDHSRMLAFIIPNGQPAAGQLEQFQVSAREIETRTGLRFFPNHSKAQRAAEPRRQQWRNTVKFGRRPAPFCGCSRKTSCFRSIHTTWKIRPSRNPIIGHWAGTKWRKQNAGGNELESSN